MIKHAFLALVLMTVNSLVWAYGTGYSAYPLSQKMRFITAEATGIFNDDGGVGTQVRYTHKLTPKLILDAGAGVASGDRESRIFVGSDYELYPDYGKQPRISVRTTLARAKEFGKGKTLLTAAPTVSKGFSFWGHEAFPFFSLPIGLNLNTDSETYSSMISGNIGITGQLPWEDFDHLSGNVELQVDLKDSATALFMGVSYPL